MLYSAYVISKGCQLDDFIMSTAHQVGREDHTTELVANTVSTNKRHIVPLLVIAETDTALELA